MTDFLFLLAKTNLAMAVAILIVALLRRPVRAVFHAPVGYALWLLVPVAALASLLPPRVVAVAAHPVSMQIPVAMRHALQTRLVAQAAPFDWTPALFALWLAGAGAMLLVMAWQQRQFHKAERLGAAGPAVTGILRPRIVIPSGFAAQFSASEQAAILAHEKAHLVRQDARINAAVALLRCLCWFNPLVHLGATWLRRDQELACDAAAIIRVPRIDYANALLKSQMRAMAPPLGCGWPASEHPLTERVALLTRQLPGRARRAAGIGAIVSLTIFAGIGAWAAQPPQAVSGGPDCPKRPGFCGKFFYSERAAESGPAFFMTLESERQENTTDQALDGVARQWRVVMHFPYGMALADSAHKDFDFDQNLADHKTITLSGNVRLMTSVTGLDVQHGQKLVFDARTGMLDLDGKTTPSGMPKYVPCTKDCKDIQK
jgi:beta-lactamase regulating signal transducer with metallopeptidase domain